MIWFVGHSGEMAHPLVHRGHPPGAGQLPLLPLGLGQGTGLEPAHLLLRHHPAPTLGPTTSPTPTVSETPETVSETPERSPCALSGITMATLSV